MFVLYGKQLSLILLRFDQLFLELLPVDDSLLSFPASSELMESLTFLIGGITFSEFVLVETYASDLIKHSPVPLIFKRIKTIPKFLELAIWIYIEIRLHLDLALVFHLLDVFLCNDIFPEVPHCLPLASIEDNFVNHLLYPRHTENLLDILFLK